MIAMKSLRSSGLIRATKGFNRSVQLRNASGHRAPLPEYITRPSPNKPLPEEYELLWDDGTAPQLAATFEVPHMSIGQGLAWWGSGVGLFIGFALVCKYVLFPRVEAEAAPKEFPYNGLKKELAGISVDDFRQIQEELYTGKKQ